MCEGGGVAVQFLQNSSQLVYCGTGVLWDWCTVGQLSYKSSPTAHLCLCYLLKLELNLRGDQQTLIVLRVFLKKDVAFLGDYKALLWS